MKNNNILDNDLSHIDVLNEKKSMLFVSGMASVQKKNFEAAFNQVGMRCFN